ncbi:MAG: hypothetical protein ACMXX9_01220 [Candidatus Woesearchaeota archaeon]
MFKEKSHSLFNYLSKFKGLDIDNDVSMNQDELSDLVFDVLDELSRAA